MTRHRHVPRRLRPTGRPIWDVTVRADWPVVIIEQIVRDLRRRLPGEVVIHPEEVTIRRVG